MSEGQESIQPFPVPDVAALHLTPNLGESAAAMTAELFKKIAATSKALLLVAYATGTSQTSLNPYISELTKQGIPVFIISDNRADNFGIRQIKYMPQVEAIKAGATPLRDPNVKNEQEVIIEIQKAINGGKTGEELVSAIVEKYGSPEGTEYAGQA